MKRLIVPIAALLAVAGCGAGSSKGSLSAVQVPKASASAAAADRAKVAEVRKQQQLKAFYAAVAKQQQLKAFYAAMAKKQQEEVQAAAAAHAAAAAQAAAAKSQQQTSTAGCGERAVQRGVFDPTCPEYQGYLDPGTSAGRAPTSGEIQAQYGCQQGYIPQSECQAQGYPWGG